METPNLKAKKGAKARRGISQISFVSFVVKAIADWANAFRPRLLLQFEFRLLELTRVSLQAHGDYQRGKGRINDASMADQFNGYLLLALFDTIDHPIIPDPQAAKILSVPEQFGVFGTWFTR